MDDAGFAVRGKDIALLRRIEERVLWLASWTIHNANHLRDSRDGLKVGGYGYDLPQFGLHEATEPGPGRQYAFTADTRAQVDAV